MGKVTLDVQHRGKPAAPGDRGAVWAGIEEVDITSDYAEALDHELRRRDDQVLWLGSGSYAKRWADSNGWDADLYVACHLDAGLGGRAGDRGLVLYDYRSPKGEALAGLVAEELSRVLPWPVRAAACRPDDDGQPRDEDYTEAWNCIHGVWAVAILLEPGFLDGLIGAAAWADPSRRREFVTAIGRAVAAGIHRWRP